MFSTRTINMNLLPMKMHYFLYLGSIASVVGFMPTVAKQLGYSPMIVGSLYTYLSILGFLIRPVCGLIVDKFPVKRFTFITCTLFCGLSAFSLNFVQQLPTVAVVDLHCNDVTSLNFCSNKSSQCDDDALKLFKNDTNLVTTCQLFCPKHELFWSEMCSSWNVSDYCTSTKNNVENNGLGYLNVSMFINTTDQVKKSTVFQITSVHFKDKEVLYPVCQSAVNTQCDVECEVNAITELAKVPNFKGNIFGSLQFWELFFVMSLFYISQTILWCLQDAICFDLLGDKPENFGKQKCWGSVSWGFFSVFGGVLVDHFSKNDFEKNYSSIFYLCLIISLCDFVLSFKIKVTETVGSKNTFSDVFKLFTKLNVIIYFIWTVVMGIYTSMIWNYLFWYMEDITSKYQSDKQPWIKTLQGLAIGIQCMFGEMPLMFFSGRIIKWMGHRNCMSLGLFVFAARFYAYSIITDPVWILPVELTHGITFGLSNAVLVAYSKKIAPPSAVTTVLAFSGALFEGVGVSLGGLVGGFLYEQFGGAWTFRLFSYSAVSMCILHALFSKFYK